RRRRGGRGLRRAGRDAVRVAPRPRPAGLPGHRARRHARLPARLARRLGDRGLRRPPAARPLRPLAAPRRGAARPGRALVRPLGRLGGARGARDAGRALVHLHPGRRLPGAARPLRGPDRRRLGRLVLRPRGGRLGRGRELGARPPRLPLRGLRGRGGDRAGRRRRRVAAGAAAPCRGRCRTWLHWPCGMIPLVDVKAQYAPLIPLLRERFAEVLESGRLIFGPEVEAFEREAAAYLDVPETVGVANGTDALVLALEAIGVGRGDEVVCPAFTFFATPEAIARTGATPVFADVDPVTLNLDPEDVAGRITPRTKAIVPVHLFGRPAPLADLAALGLPLIEDAAQAFGAPGVAGTGICSTFSFFPTKNLFALGDGGLVACRDADVAARVRKLRFHGSEDKRTHELVGTNSRLDAVQAAMLRVFLPRLAGWNAARRQAAGRYAELGLGEAVELPLDE